MSFLRHTHTSLSEGVGDSGSEQLNEAVCNSPSEMFNQSVQTSHIDVNTSRSVCWNSSAN